MEVKASQRPYLWDKIWKSKVKWPWIWRALPKRLCVSNYAFNIRGKCPCYPNAFPSKLQNLFSISVLAEFCQVWMPLKRVKTFSELLGGCKDFNIYLVLSLSVLRGQGAPSGVLLLLMPVSCVWRLFIPFSKLWNAPKTLKESRFLLVFWGISFWNF